MKSNSRFRQNNSRGPWLTMSLFLSSSSFRRKTHGWSRTIVVSRRVIFRLMWNLGIFLSGRKELSPAFCVCVKRGEGHEKHSFPVDGFQINIVRLFRKNNTVRNE